MKFTTPHKNYSNSNNSSFYQDSPQYLSTDITQFTQSYPKPNVIRVNQARSKPIEIPSIKIHYLGDSPQQIKFKKHQYPSKKYARLCECYYMKSHSSHFLDDDQDKKSICKKTNGKCQKSFMSKVSKHQEYRLSESFDQQMFNQIALKNQKPHYLDLKRSQCVYSQYGQNSCISNLSSCNSGLKLGLKIICNKIEWLKKKKAGQKLIRHLKITQFVFKLNYIVKFNFFINIQSAFYEIKQRKKIIQLAEACQKIKKFLSNKNKKLKAIGFIRIKLVKQINMKSTLIPFSLILRKILCKRILTIKKNIFQKISSAGSQNFEMK